LFQPKTIAEHYSPQSKLKKRRAHSDAERADGAPPPFLRSPLVEPAANLSAAGGVHADDPSSGAGREIARKILAAGQAMKGHPVASVPNNRRMGIALRDTVVLSRVHGGAFSAAKGNLEFLLANLHHRARAANALATRESGQRSNDQKLFHTTPPSNTTPRGPRCAANQLSRAKAAIARATIRHGKKRAAAHAKTLDPCARSPAPASDSAAASCGHSQVGRNGEIIRKICNLVN
jgi:hypothetical protein